MNYKSGQPIHVKRGTVYTDDRGRLQVFQVSGTLEVLTAGKDRITVIDRGSNRTAVIEKKALEQ